MAGRRQVKVLLLCVIGSLVATVWLQARAFAVGEKSCGGEWQTRCGVNSNQDSGQFHGLIAVQGAPWVFAASAHSGTKAGCGDCTWSIVLACPEATPGDPGSERSCAAASDAAACHRRQLLYRIYLTTDAVTDEIAGTICLGGARQPIPIGDHAAADVQRYLKNVIPPGLDITTRPKTATLAGLATYFSARPPATLKPVPFGGPEITETITIAPSKADWRWGDSEASGWTKAASTLTHSYIHGGSAHGDLTTRWGATYTITYGGQTFGPYDATGHLTKRQAFTLPVHTSSPTLVSH
jgi:hypothetical protein